jgi:hypothetical protein
MCRAPDLDVLRREWVGKGERERGKEMVLRLMKK